MEIKEIEGTNYLVSSNGDIINAMTGRVLSLNKNRKGYLNFNMYVNGVGSTQKVHRIVAMLFCEGYSEDLHVNHKDGNKSNNRASNLEWVTALENTQHAKDTGLILKGELSPNTLLSDADVEAIKLAFVENISSTEIAKAFGVTPSVIGSIRQKQTRQDVRPDLDWYVATKFAKKLSVDDISEVRKLFEKGFTNQEIAKKFGVSRENIYRIRAGKAWVNY
jgi:predicted DNA-binding protein YlxM (UPF0122 family)